MTTATLDKLIKEATLNVIHASHGQRPEDHEWVYAAGGRGCPRGGINSQALYECSICGEFDYGDPPGPGFHDCFDDIHGCEGCLSFDEIETIRDRLNGQPWDPLTEYRRINTHEPCDDKGDHTRSL